MSDPVFKVAAQPQRPLLLFDGDCRFCRRWATRWRNATGEAVYYVPLQDERVAQWFPEIPAETLREAIHLIETDGSVYSGAAAAIRALSAAPQKRWLWWLYQQVPAFAQAAEFAYRAVARHRTILSAVTRFFTGGSSEAPTYVVTRSIFLKSLGAIYLIAFVSWWTQQSALIGSNGILPAPQTMMVVEKQLKEAHHRSGAPHELTAWAKFRAFPTLCWFDASDGFLNSLCAAGTAMAALLMLGFAPLPMLVGLWLFYLSLARVGGDFMSFQWDYLLLEAGFAAIFFAPLHPLPDWLRNWQARIRGRSEGALGARALPSAPPRIGLILLWALLFKLMFMSGVVKLVAPPGMNPDATWQEFTALTYHYWTQPLPMPTAWWAAQLPLWFQKFSCGAMFFIEIWLPFLFFAPRRLRLFACAGQLLLQALIMLTGNYCFFNLLTVALCFTLVDDATWRSIWRWICRAAMRRPKQKVAAGVDAPLPEPRVAVTNYWWVRWIGNAARLCAAAMVLTVSFVYVANAANPTLEWQPWVHRHIQRLGPFGIANSYGLFRYMTLTRPEILIEGSDDGMTWKEYHFKYKPGDLSRRPRINQPHQPRLDWQMWFEALHAERLLAMRQGQPNVWFQNFCFKLLQGDKGVLALMQDNPFSDRPPRRLRATLYQYKFTNRSERAQTGHWWKRQQVGEYVHLVSRADFGR